MATTYNKFIDIPSSLSDDLLTKATLSLLARNFSTTLHLHKPRRLEVIASNVDVLTNAVERIIDLFYNPEALLLMIRTAQDEKIHVFVDNSNIFLCSQMIEKTSGMIERDFEIRLNIPELVEVVEQGRFAMTRFVAGSKPGPNHTMWDHWRRSGYDARVFTSIPGIGEEGVDNTIVAEIQKKLLLFQDKQHTLVLLTGDGNDNGGMASFIETAHAALVNSNWKVEVWCWRNGCSQNYQQLQKLYSGQEKYLNLNFLDAYRDRVTFKAGEIPQPPKLVRVFSNDQGETNLEIDEDMMNCPITNDLIRDPVKTPHTPHYYEREAIVAHIELKGCCPMSYAPLVIEDLLDPDGQYLFQLAKYWDEYLCALPVVIREEEEKHLPAFVHLFRHQAWQASQIEGAKVSTEGSVTDHDGPPVDPKYKTAMCKTWLAQGSCPYGSKCNFAHGQHQLKPSQAAEPPSLATTDHDGPPVDPKYKTAMCKTWLAQGSCPYGNKCNFAHGQHQLKPSQAAEPPSLATTDHDGPPVDPKYKTAMCKTWLAQGSCPYGSKCNFAHGQHQLKPSQAAESPSTDHDGPPVDPKYKTAMCKTWLAQGSCPYGSKCNFAHGQHQLKPSQAAEPPSLATTDHDGPPVDPKYKTAMCKTWLAQGSCPYGSKCNFAHGQHQLK